MENNLDLRTIYRNNVCPVCNDGLIFNNDYTKANCKNSKCNFNKECIIGIDLAKEDSPDNTVQYIKCPRCETINYIKEDQDQSKCVKCNARFNILR